MIAFSLTGCKDDEPTPQPEQEPVAYLALYHTAPDAPDLDLLFNNQLQSQVFKYPNSYPYQALAPGDYRFSFNTVNATTSVVDSTIALEENKIYTLFLVGRNQDLDLLVLKDTLEAPAAGKADIQFLNLAPDAPEVKLETTGTSGATLFNEVAFKESTSFTEVDPGTLTFQVKEAGGTGELLRELRNYQIVAGRKYIFVLRGLQNPPAGNTNTLNIQVIQI
ncbi:DUF4397 domain-containing protein [Botryobacter ruber]|uniref:DUF4397 domain-containing protein n=1 Tax=Botryobacter ruber TaxID=2171629 RepID=UPI001F0BB0E9|nr:DUF4397 domain-containing protein [Botryobacter ruber]